MAKDLIFHRFSYIMLKNAVFLSACLRTYSEKRTIGKGGSGDEKAIQCRDRAFLQILCARRRSVRSGPDAVPKAWRGGCRRLLPPICIRSIETGSRSPTTVAVGGTGGIVTPVGGNAFGYAAVVAAMMEYFGKQAETELVYKRNIWRIQN